MSSDKDDLVERAKDFMEKTADFRTTEEWMADFAAEVSKNALAAALERERVLRDAVAKLVDSADAMKDAIATQPTDTFGVGGDGETHYFIRDELVGRCNAALAALKDAEVKDEPKATLTREALSKMKPAEIAMLDWEDVRKALAKDAGGQG